MERTWKDPRPRIAVLLSINDTNSEYVLTRVSEKGYGQRLALDATAKALALPIALPKAADGAIAESPAAPARLEGIWR